MIDLAEDNRPGRVGPVGGQEGCNGSQSPNARERGMDQKLIDGSAETPRNMAVDAAQFAAAAARPAAPTAPQW